MSHQPATEELPTVSDSVDSQVLGLLRHHLEKLWSAETSADPEGYGVLSAKASYGQCAVTALIVQDIFGGELLRCTVDGVSHYFNRIKAGSQVDLTRDQFPTWAQFTDAEERSRDYVLSHPATLARYELLRAAAKTPLPSPGRILA